MNVYTKIIVDFKKLTIIAYFYDNEEYKNTGIKKVQIFKEQEDSVKSLAEDMLYFFDDYTHKRVETGKFKLDFINQ